MKQRIALQLYTLRDLLTTKDDIARTFDQVREIGYEFVQVSGVSGATCAELAPMLATAGLKCMATHTSLDAIRDNPAAVIQELVDLECYHTAVAWLPNEFRTAEGFRNSGKTMGKAAEKFREEGFTLSYHNHSFEYERFDGQTGHEIIADAGGPDLCFEFDTYWLVNAGCDPIVYLLDHAGRVPLLHLKDMAVVSDKPVMAEVGFGNLNWEGIIKASEKAGTEWLIVEQDHCLRDPLESVAMSLQFLSEGA